MTDNGTAACKVFLVGAGPGDPLLITLKALQRLKQAEVVVYDRLVSDDLVQESPAGAEMIFAGKAAGESGHDQESINRLLIEKAREGKRVVRLKGGDPFVFGRGGEEALALREAGIPFEVVPGVTSAVAVPAYAGIPVTHRGLASSFAVITGHEDQAKEESAIDWERLAKGADTLVFLMGTKSLPEIAERLVQHGRAPETPAAVIRWGTTPEQRTVTGTLGDIAARAQEAGITPPAITVVGEVVRLREQLSWFEGRPLFGKRVLITRTREQASRLAALLVEEGAVPVELPSIELQPAIDEKKMSRAIGNLLERRYDWTVFTSANAVEVFFDFLWSRGFDARLLGRSYVAAIGPETEDALGEWGIAVDVVPDDYVGESLLEALDEFEEGDLKGKRFLLPRAEGSRDLLIKGLESRGGKVDELTLYRAAVPATVPDEVMSALRDGQVDIVTFTASSTVRNLITMLGGDTGPLERPVIACIGPITAQTARELGLRVDIEAPGHTVEGLVNAVREWVEARRA